MECMCVGVDACVSACEGEAERERETQRSGAIMPVLVLALMCEHV